MLAIYQWGRSKELRSNKPCVVGCSSGVHHLRPRALEQQYAWLQNSPREIKCLSVVKSNKRTEAVSLFDISVSSQCKLVAVFQ